MRLRPSGGGVESSLCVLLHPVARTATLSDRETDAARNISYSSGWGGVYDQNDRGNSGVSSFGLTPYPVARK